MAEDRFIDLTPEPGKKRKVMLTDKDITFIKDNPAGLTKEGAQAELYDWLNNSKNKYQQARYLSMVQNCKSFTKSGKLANGKTILARDKEGNVTWAEWLDVNMKRCSKKEWDSLPEEKRY